MMEGWLWEVPLVLPMCTGCSRPSRPPLWCTSVRAEVTRMFCEIASAHGICPKVHYPVPEFATLAGGDWVQRIPQALVALGLGLYNPITCSRAAHVQLQSQPGNIVTLRTAKLRQRDITA